MLYEIIIFALFKMYDFGERCRFYVLYSNQSNLVCNYSTNKQHCFYQNKQEKSSYLYSRKYDDMNRSVYQNSVYIVKPGDTLFYIAWITGNNYLDLARDNNIKNINVLQINQVLNVKNDTVNIFSFKKKIDDFLLFFYENFEKAKNIFFLKKKWF